MPTDLLSSLSLQLSQFTVLLVIAALLDRVVADRAPRLALLIWLVVALKGVTPPWFSSPLGVFSWGSAPTIDLATAPAFVAPWTDIVVRVLLGLWGLGVVLLAGITLRQQFLMWKHFRSGAIAADDPLFTYVRQLAATHRLMAPSRVVVSPNDWGPAMAGVVSPTLVLPTSLVSDQSPTALRAVILHELVHASRRDTLVAMLLVLLRVLWWCHPLVWWAAHRVEGLVERCVDLTVTRDLKTGVVEYGRGLLRVLEVRSELPIRGGLATLSPCQITLERLQFLRQVRSGTLGRWSEGTSLRFSRLALATLAALVVLPGHPIAAPPCTEAPLEFCQPLEVRLGVASAAADRSVNR